MKWNTLEELQEQIKLQESNPKALYHKIKKHMNYSIDYAEDRVENIVDNWDEELYVDCVSSPYFRNKQVKTTTDELSEADGTLTDHLDRIANYILYSSFNNEEEKKEWEILKEEKKKASKENKLRIRDKQKNRSGLLSHPRKSRTNYKIIRLDDKEKTIKHFDVTDEDLKNKTFYTFEDKELNQKKQFKNSKRYWQHFGQHNFSTLDSIFSNTKVADFNTPFWKVAYEDLEMKTIEINKLEKEIKELKTIPQIKKKEDMLRRIKKDYNFVSRILRDPVILKTHTAKKSKDPWIAIERRLAYSDKEIIKIILYNYKNIQNEYGDNISSIMWCVLKDLESALNKIKISKIQKTIVSIILNNNNWDYKEIEQEILIEHQKETDKKLIYYHLNKIIEKVCEYFYNKEVGYND